LTGEDLDLVPDYDQRGNFYLKAFVKPLVNLIWLAGIVFLAGSLIALWPDAREQRRLVERYATRRGLVEA
ncbi:MAG: Cytochrome c-type biosis protein CcmF C-terminal, partial [Gaiellaceae bacterium]|nr:Cytochrome c-type biosis protein CcmF C-terminal [Gaiellaceae bacterium]